MTFILIAGGVWLFVAVVGFALCRAAGIPTPSPPGTRETPDDRHRGGL